MQGAKLTDPQQPLPVPPEQGRALFRAAGEIRSLLPRRRITRDNDGISHHIISQADLVRLRFAGRHELSPWVQLAWGSVIGVAAPFVAAVVTYVRNPASPAFDTADYAAVNVMAISLIVAIILTIVSRRTPESVETICEEISKRPKLDDE